MAAARPSTASAGSASAARHDRARQRGHRGGTIPLHRSIWRLHLPHRRLAEGLLLAAGFSLLLVLVQPALARFWAWQLTLWLTGLGLGTVNPGAPLPLDPDAGWAVFSLVLPQIDIALPDVGPLQLAAHALVAAAVWGAAGWLPDSGKPGTYVLRFAVLIHGAAVAYFALWPGSFAHSLAGHVRGGLEQTWMLMLVAPWLHLATHYLFPFPLWQRLALTTLTLAWLALLAPLQYSAHAALLALTGPVLMPLLHLLFGVMVPILGLVALYGWGMSWPQAAPERRSGEPG